MAHLARERTSGDLGRSFVGGTLQEVDDGLNARDGRLFLFLAADWQHLADRGGLDIKPVQVKKGVTIPVHVQVKENLLMCSCIIVMHGKQCGPLHLALVAHCREWLWSKTTPAMSRRVVEGSGMVDYLNILWCIDSNVRLYRNVTSSVGMCSHRSESSGFWDGFWYIYRRGETTPAYSHIGLDTSATLNNQKHVAGGMKECIEDAYAVIEELPNGGEPLPSKQGGIFGSFTRMFSKR